MEINHIYNGEIIDDNNTIKMVEFKLISTTNVKKLFIKGHFHCAWFVLKGENIEGPLSIDTELIKVGKRVIKDEEFPHLTGKEIKNLTKEGLFDSKNIPTQIKSLILTKIEN